MTKIFFSFRLWKKHLSACGYAEVRIVISPCNSPMKEEEMMQLVHTTKDLLEA